MDESFLVKVLANYGFPIALSWFLLIRMESRIERLTEGIDELKISIQGLKHS